MTAPGQVDVWAGLDAGKGGHFADVLDNDGRTVQAPRIAAKVTTAIASLRDPASKAFYDRTRAAGKRHNAALICLARRRCDVILAILRTGQPYQPARPAPGLPRAA